MTDSPTPSTLSPQAPIGLFDSGVGGLSVYLHLKRLLPHENYLYFADTVNVPYGDRTGDQIEALTLAAVDWLYQKGCKLIVIACNSGSAHALVQARLHYPNIPIVGLVPALKPAVLASQTKRVAVLATKATLEGSPLNRVIEEIALPHQTEVIKCFEPRLVPWVEAGMPTMDPTYEWLLARVQTFYQDGVDHLVLGCTHYPFFRAMVQDHIEARGWQMQVVDSGYAIAMRVHYLLSQLGLLSRSEQAGRLYFFSSKVSADLQWLVERLLPRSHASCMPKDVFNPADLAQIADLITP